MSNIRQVLNKIIGEKIKKIGRTADMMWVCFGKDVNTVNYKGESVVKTKYSFNIQCSWRIKNEKQILFASNDIYKPNSLTEQTDDFDWDIQGNNLFDEKSKTWLKQIDNHYIIEAVLNSCNDLFLTLSNGDVLETFIDTSEDDECWRLLDYGENHIVVTGSDVQLQ